MTKIFDFDSWENEQSSIKNIINPQNYKVSETIKKIVFGSIQIDDTACKELDSAIKWRRMILLRIPMDASIIYPENASFFCSKYYYDTNTPKNSILHIYERNYVGI